MARKRAAGAKAQRTPDTHVVGESTASARSRTHALVVTAALGCALACLAAVVWVPSNENGQGPADSDGSRSSSDGSRSSSDGSRSSSGDVSHSSDRPEQDVGVTGSRASTPSSSPSSSSSAESMYANAHVSDDAVVAIRVVVGDTPPPLSTDGNVSLKWLLHPLAVSEWESHHWDKEPVLLRRPPTAHDALASGLDAVDALLTAHAAEHTKPLLMHPSEPRTQADCSVVREGMADRTPTCVGGL
jgi:hypothetical protein